MSNSFSRIKLDVLSLNWLGQDPEHSRSAGMMSISYHESLNVKLMKQTIVNLFTEYPFFCCNLEYLDGYYYFRVPNDISPDEVESRLHFTNISQDELFEDLSMKEINLFTDDLYQLYFLDHGNSFDIVIYGAHLIGDGLTSATGLSILLYNYYLATIGRINDQIYPEMKYRQLVKYAYRMRHTRFGILWVPRWFRFIPGYFAYRKNISFDVPDQVFNQPVPLEEPLLRIEDVLESPFNDLLLILKESHQVNSNHLISALISYALMKSQNYERAITTYPINIRNKYGFEAGNLLTANRVELIYHDNFIDHLIATRDLLEKEKKKSGPYYAISLAKFVKNDYETIKKRMSKLVQQSNLRFSNVGGLPAPNLNMIDETLFDQIPLSNYHANALPLGAIGVHFFITNLKNNLQTNYYLTVLYSKETEEPVNEVIEVINTTIREVFGHLTAMNQLD